VGCYIGSNFVGALAYADDIVLIAPNPSAMRKLLSVCDIYANEYDIIFNAEKSNFLVFNAIKHRSIVNDMTRCKFFVGGNLVENAERYSHLGHIISSSASNNEDIVFRRNCFIGHVNNVLCFFNKLDLSTKIKLFKAYCTSIYGCELWTLNNKCVEDFCVAWRKALRRVLNIPHNSHTFLLPILTDTLPVFDEICKRSARFILSCLFGVSRLVRSVAWHSIVVAKYNSVLGNNALLCCERYGWTQEDFVHGFINLDNNVFSEFCAECVSDSERNSALFLLEVLYVREGRFSVVMPPGFDWNSSELNDIISAICTL